MREAVRGLARDQVRRAANRTMRHNAARDGRGYARVPMGGEACGFCIMLASRGFVYRSAQTAGEGNHYHSDCRCKVIPGFGGMTVEGYDPSEYARRYHGSLQLTPYGTVDMRATVRAMDRGNYRHIRESRNARRRELYAMRKAPGGVSRRERMLATSADPARDVIGSAEETNPERLGEIMERYAQDGAEVIWSDVRDERMGYAPRLGDHAPQVHLTRGMSILAHEHEFTHHEMCVEQGITFGDIMPDDDMRWEFEKAACLREISLARAMGYNSLVEQYEKLMEAERRRIYGEELR